MAKPDSSVFSRWTKRRRLLANVQKTLDDIAFLNEIASDQEHNPTLAASENSLHVFAANIVEQPAISYVKTDSFIDDPSGDGTITTDGVNDFTEDSTVTLDILGNAIESGSESDDELNVTSDDKNQPFQATGIKEELTKWAVDLNINHSSISRLLKILVDSGKHPELPIDARTLLKTSTTVQTKLVAGGSYYHLGLQAGIISILENFSPSEDQITLQVNIDGIPIFKSSNAQFWPILGLVNEAPCKEPFIIGIFYGNHKPSPVADFLKDFIEEAKNLENDFVYESRTYTLKISAVICDTPARAFVKNVKGHSGYSGCDKCTQKGLYLNHRMTFPETNAPLRSDVSFNEMSDEDHHLGLSPFTELKIGMVSSFPLDYMHLICLGVVRKLLYLWSKGPLKTRQGPRIIEQITNRLLLLKPYISREFSRKPRTLKELDNWKATEFRQFLLYTGQVCLPGLLPDAMFKNFQLLVVGIYILLSPTLSTEFCVYAGDILILFVRHFGDLYGKEFLSYNIHCVVHLADEVRLHGPLDNISAFVFENYLGKIKRLIRKPHRPLEQVAKRFSERKKSIKTMESNVFEKNHCEGPVPQALLGSQQYKEYNITCHQSITTTTTTDNCVKVGHNICLVKNFVSNRQGQYVVYQRFLSLQPLYNYPLDSTILGVYMVSELDDQLLVAEVTSISTKYVLLPKGRSFAAIPFLHM